MKKNLLLLIFLCMVSAVQALSNDYIVGSGDILMVSVWGVPTLSGDVIVRPDGKITIAAVGDVVASGKTAAQIASDLQGVVSEYVKQPVVTVAVKTITNNKIFVIGEGVSSRVIQFQQMTTLMRLLAGVGDLKMADLENARVLRAGKVVHKDFYALYTRGNITTDFKLQADDIIFIPSNVNKRIFVLGAVDAPQVLPYEEGKTVLDAILRCGGFDEHADREDIKLIRKNAAPEQISFVGVLDGESVEKNPTLQPGDYIIVASFENDRIYVSGAVKAPGAIIYKRHTKLLDAINAAGGLNEYANPKKLILFSSDGEKRTINIADMVDGKSMGQNISLNPGDHIVVRESLF